MRMKKVVFIQGFERLTQMTKAMTFCDQTHTSRVEMNIYGFLWLMTSSSTELNPWFQNVYGNSTEDAAPTSPWEKTIFQLG